MLKSMRRGAFLLFIAALFISCAPNRAMTKSNDGMSSHGDKTVKAEPAQSDSKYAADDEFDIEEAEVETAEKIPPVSAPKKNAKVKQSVKKAPVAEDVEPVAAKSSADYHQTGKASWYGREFHGKKTASGEKFNMNELTAAHKTLPLGTVVTVKNLENGKSVKVKINDRGPFVKGRIIDLSHAAAKKIDMIQSGEVKVGLSIAGKEVVAADADDNFEEIEEKAVRRKNSRVKAVSYTDTNSDGAFMLQTGAFYSKKNAEKLKTRLEELLPEKEVSISHDGSFYKVKVSGIASKKEAERHKKTLTSEEIESFVVEQE